MDTSVGREQTAKSMGRGQGQFLTCSFNWRYGAPSQDGRGDKLQSGPAEPKEVTEMMHI